MVYHVQCIVWCGSLWVGVMVFGGIGVAGVARPDVARCCVAGYDVLTVL